MVALLWIVSAQSDTSMTVYLEEVEVRAKALPFSQSVNLTQIENNALDVGDLSLIKKGPFSPDLYYEGFKKFDIQVSVEGERVYNTCPNRMDGGVMRYFSLHYNNLVISGSAANLQAGIGGIAYVTRKAPTENLTFEVLENLGIQTTNPNGLANQTSFTISAKKQRFSFTYLTQNDYTFGANTDTLPDNFLDRYMYGYDTDIYEPWLDKNINLGKTLSKYMLLSYTGEFGKYQFNVDITNAGPVLFPYLMMDEIFTKGFDASIKHADLGKVYFTYTHHFMSNIFRPPYYLMNKMYMGTDAKKKVFGYVASFGGLDIDFVYRNWDTKTRTIMYMSGQPMYDSTVNTIDNYNNFRLTGAYKTDLGFAFFHTKIGVSLEKAGHNGTPIQNLDYVAGLDISRPFNTPLGIVSLFAELATDIPDPKYRYFYLETPWMRKNDTLFCKKIITGNPALKSQKRIAVGATGVLFDLKLNYVADYPYYYGYMTIEQISGNTYMTKYYEYRNINAFIGSFSFKYDYRNLLGLRLAYSYGWNTTDKKPLPEIMPLRVQLYAKTPEWNHLSAKLSYLYTMGKDSTMIDPALEITSPSYNKVDFEIKYAKEKFNIALGVENLLNVFYYEPLNYVRDPFMAPNNKIVPVYEKGRNFYLKFYYKNF